MEIKYWYLIIGIAIGWLTKFPLILKWYRQIKETKEYKELQLLKRIKEFQDKDFSQKVKLQKNGFNKTEPNP